jgi:hypothetical protein
VSRTRRVGPPEGFWSTVDAWAADVVEPSRVRAWWGSRCHLDATSGPFLDVIEPFDGAGVRARLARDAVAARGIALADDPAVRTALAEAGVEHRRVAAARRYRWHGPALAPVVLELHATGDEAVVEAWWEDVWAAWPTIPLGRESEDRRPPRRVTARAQIGRLLDALGHQPLGRLPD